MNVDVGGAAGRVIGVDSKREVEEAVGAIGAAGECLVPFGAGRRLHIGNPPDRCDVALSVRGLNEVEGLRADDMTVSVQAGMTLSELNERLAECGQHLPIDAAAPEQTTIGGLIAADAFGSKRYAHGKVRDFLLGIEVVIGTGECVRAGGRVVKNVAGYDLGKLLVGSYGTLGVIVSATFKTKPLAKRQSVLAFAGDDLGAVLALVPAAAAAGVSATAVDAIDGKVCRSLDLHCAAALVVAVAGSEVEVAAMQVELVARLGRTAAVWTNDEAESMLERLRLRTLPAAGGEDCLIARVAIRPTEIAAVISRACEEARAAGVEVEVWAHAASGAAWCRSPVPEGGVSGLASYAKSLRRVVCERGGWVVFESLPPALRGEIDVWGFDARPLRLMRGVKKVFDPNGTFAPGRFAGGI